jgi:drug/metabolite transporter (DMT)-like permease
MLQDRRFQGYLFAFLAALGYGSASTLGKFSLSAASPLLIASIAGIIGGAMLFPYKPSTRIERNNILPFLVVTFCGAILGPLLFYTGLQHTSAVSTALLSNGELLFTSIIAILIFRERLSRRQYLASILVVFGIVAISTNLDLSGTILQGSLTGNLLILGATVSWGIENNIARVLSERMNTIVMARYRNLLAGLVLLAIILASRTPIALGSQTLPFVILTGIIPVGLTTVLLFSALGRIGAVRTLLVFSTGSLFGILYAHLFLGEAITPVQIGGGAVLFTGIVLISRNEKASSPAEGR